VSARIGFLAAAIVIGLALLVSGGQLRHRLDCGAEGKATLDGRACIDREPVSIP
jgi:hypothetical protein